MTTASLLSKEIYRQKGAYSKHPSVPWFNDVTGSSYYATALFCASGLSQAFNAIGLGKATGGPFIWTVAWYEWCKNNLSQVALANAQDGDITFFKFPAFGDRAPAPVNHVTTYRGRSGTSVLVRGFNEGAGGTGGVVGDAAYSQNYLVAIFRTPWGSESSPRKETTIMKKHYHREDATARSGGRALAPGGQFYLHTDKNLPTSKASNVIGGVGPYSLTAHVYAEGLPGDTVDLAYMFQDVKAKKNSDHYTETVVIGADGKAKVNVEFKRAAVNGTAVYLRCRAGKSNKGSVRVTVLDSDAYLFATA